MTENQNSDFRKETGNDWTTVHPNKNSKALSSRHSSRTPKLVIAITSRRSIPNKFLGRKITQYDSQGKDTQSWVMPLGENQIFAQQKDASKLNSNCKNQKYYQETKHAGTLRVGKKILMIR